VRSDKLYPAVLIRNFISAHLSLLKSLRFSVQISQPYKTDGLDKILHSFK